MAENLILRPHQEELHSESPQYVQNSPEHPLAGCAGPSRYSVHINHLTGFEQAKTQRDPSLSLFILFLLQLLTRTVALKTPTTQPIRRTRSITARDIPHPATLHGPSCPATSTSWRSGAAAGRSPTWTAWKSLIKELQGEKRAQTQ